MNLVFKRLGLKMNYCELRDYIEILNNVISEIERPIINEELFPNMFIYGVPRSGTTLLSQILIYCLDVGYINNLIARFYKAPFLGAILSEELKIPKEISFKSSFGRTPLISDPHEFGYFWSEMLGLKHNNTHNISVSDFAISRSKLEKMKKELLSLNYVIKKPYIFKNILTGLFIKEISSILKKSVFIYIERDPFNNAVSLLLARERLYQNKNKWFSLKPKEWKELKDKSPEEQVAGQVFYLRKEFEDKMKNMENVIKLKYESLCKSPTEEVEKVLSFVFELTGYRIKLINQVKPFVCKKFNPEDFPAVKQAIDKYFSE